MILPMILHIQLRRPKRSLYGDEKNFLFSCNLMGQMGRKGRRDHTYFMMWNSFWIYSLFSTVKPYARIKMFVGFILNTFSNSANWKYFWRDCTSTRFTLIENFVISNCIYETENTNTLLKSRLQKLLTNNVILHHGIITSKSFIDWQILSPPSSLSSLSLDSSENFEATAMSSFRC